MNSLLPDPAASLLDRSEITALEVVEQLLLEELTFREDRRIRTALRMGRLNTVKRVRFAV